MKAANAADFCSVHPHACGEIPICSHWIPFVGGSSPRLWGDLCHPTRCRAAKRFIPTPVGRFKVEGVLSRQCTVHPHACGEIWCCRGACMAAIGSSPRLWGDLATVFIQKSHGRFIPTPVGRLVHPVCLPAPAPVHPHACGEITASNRQVNLTGGSSPRLWGDLPHPPHNVSWQRFIPTPVGRLGCLLRPAFCTAVHPHACGEIQINQTPSRPLCGSSPRLWGDYQYLP